MLLLCALIVGSSSLWAQATETFTFNTDAGLSALGIAKPGTGAGTDLGSTVYYSGDVSLSATNGSTNTRVWNSKGTLDLRIYNGGTLTFTAPGNITSIVLTGSTVNGFTCTEGTFSSGTWSAGSTTSVTSVVLSATATEKINTIAVTYTVASKTDPTITFNNSSVRVGKTLDVSTLFESNSLGAVTYSITAGNSYASISGSTLTGVAEGSVTVQASQAATGSYNAMDVTATISVTDPALSSIAITTAPTKTTYDEGDLFDATDMVVTATFADDSEEDVTSSCTWSPNGALTPTDTEITVSYTYKEVTKTATQDITVNAYTQPTTISITNWNTLFGTSYSGSVSNVTDNAPLSGKKDRLNVIYAGTGNHYVTNSQIRFYPNNKLTFEAPAGYAITKIEFTSGSNWGATISSDNGTYNSSTKTWTGAASTVLLTGSGSSRCDMNQATITLANTVDIAITAAGLATFVADAPLDYAGISGIEAYIAKENGTKIELTKVEKVAAGTGVLLRATDNGTDFTIPVTTGDADDVTGNIFVRGTGAAVATTDATYTNYILSTKSGVVGFYHANNNIVAVNRAYLHTSVSAARIDLNFDELTGINEVKNQKEAVEGIFDLQGRKIAQPARGLYIVNGKKVVIK